jgi:hypothetical protein
MGRSLMALVAALLLTLVLSAMLAGSAMVAGVERRTASAYRVSAALRMAAAGGIALAAEELERREWASLLAGAGSDTWMQPGSPGADVAALSAAIRRETMLATSHGADTPVWQVVAHVPWARVAGHAGGVGDLVVWVADDWEEVDGVPAEDRNDRVLVRAAAVDGSSVAWAEALCGRDPDGRVRPRHLRLW